MIQPPVTTNRVDTTKRQKQCQRLRRRARLSPFTQPMMPPTRKARATTTVTQAEAITGNSSANTPSTSSRMPSATVKLRREPRPDSARSDVMGVVENNTPGPYSGRSESSAALEDLQPQPQP